MTTLAELSPDAKYTIKTVTTQTGVQGRNH